jgi:lipopolysaccharide/colanic/teichoic acid biosynthesis glycosyltransferase
MNVLKGDMSLVGPATLEYRDEETSLQTVDHPERYNSEVIYPDKARISREYGVTKKL